MSGTSTPSRRAFGLKPAHEQNQIDNNLIFGRSSGRNGDQPGVETGGASGIYVLGADRLIVGQNRIMNMGEQVCMRHDPQ